ncbi:MAG: Fe-S oxidoreductase [Bacteroidetes bacterium GWF2_33_38]|nr:MAG: Fe-S oxidoreductase [Bacteroidetes bacterium GWF2_33_38]OFY76154.1 MAG: Fe-S oxidoreductase [Bacteroidetes bacterium RIFOXYA12_FULL_33_9]OFY91705.1 MAG: Fe-S oxidoreductase [Bacteroidetes bacterium RIFOXYA2_FULL_33_7]
MKIDLFVPCFIDQLYPEIAFNTMKLFKKLMIDVEYNPEQTCCGQPAFNSGFWSESREVATKFMSDFAGERIIVSLSASCGGFIKNKYPVLFKESEKHEEAVKFSTRVFELTDFLVNKCKINNTDSEFSARITFHDACSAIREYGLKNEARTLLNNVKGLEIIEMEESDVCCGFGGAFSAKFDAISTAMVERKVNNAIKTGAEYIVSTEASCLMNMESYIKKQKLSIKTMHIANILASGI